ncbi:helix-turn-helix domain-containing protein [Tissierellaceae bacterium HCP3S3_D8]
MFSKDIFSNRIKEERLKKDLKQSELGKVVGLSDNAISDIERGYRLTTIDKIVELADFFDVSIDYLAGRTDNPKINR